MLEKLKAINPICRMVNEHRKLCREVVDEAKMFLKNGADTVRHDHNRREVKP